MSSLSNVPVEAIRTEAAAIRELLIANRWGIELTPVDVDGERSPLVRAFWEEIGWDDDLAGFHMADPDFESGMLQARDWEIEYSGYDPERQSFSLLPARSRAVWRDGDGCAFLVTDESGTEADPPLICLTGEEEAGDKVHQYCGSYLRWMGTALVEQALHGWYNTWTVNSEPALGELATQRPFPHLAPGARRIGDELWVAPNTMEDIMDDECCGGHLAARSFEALGEWLSGEPRLRRIQFGNLPGESHAVSATPATIRAEPGDWVEIEGMRAGRAYRIGALAGVPVIVEIKGESVTVAASPRDSAAIKAELSRRSW